MCYKNLCKRNFVSAEIENFQKNMGEKFFGIHFVTNFSRQFMTVLGQFRAV